jgi:ribonuclease HI
MAPNQLGAAFVTVSADGTTTTLVHPNGAGTTNTINRAELSAIHMALQHGDLAAQPTVTLYTDSLCSIQLINQALYRPEELRTHKHHTLLANVATLLQARTQLGLHTAIRKVKSHIGIQGNELADQGANRAAKGTALPTDTQAMETTPPEAYQHCVWLACTKKDA